MKQSKRDSGHKDPSPKWAGHWDSHGPAFRRGLMGLGRELGVGWGSANPSWESWGSIEQGWKLGAIRCEALRTSVSSSENLENDAWQGECQLQ